MLIPPRMKLIGLLREFHYETLRSWFADHAVVDFLVLPSTPDVSASSFVGTDKLSGAMAVSSDKKQL